MKARPPSPIAPRVRMYRQGLGDCFLVSLPGASGSPCHVLIDCGVQAGTPGEADLMARVARDIGATTGGRLDLVVVTHDHWDHVSGFAQARAEFDRIAIGEVWLGRAEDPADPESDAIRRGRDRALRGLRVLANRLGGPGADANDAASAGRLRVPLSFFGPASGAGPREAIDYLRDHPSRPRVRYRRPGGRAVPLPGSAGSLAYVLGPPRGPSPEGSGPSASLALFAASGGVAIEDDEAAKLCHAFDPRYRLDPEIAARQPFFREEYLDPAGSWRRIGADWMNAAEPLALALDGQAKDRSLALAIEVEPGGRVLLFPGDAQAGRWPAWLGLGWPGEGPASPATTAADLLGRTVLYKVGHHGAAGATPDAGGLDLMDHPDLVAMIPVDAGLADASGWRMPCPDLLARLVRATRGRVLRSDRGFPDRPEGVTSGEWDAFRESVTFDPGSLFIDFHLNVEGHEPRPPRPRPPASPGAGPSRSA